MIPTKIGPYEIRAEIGQGGMAIVYRAYQSAADRDVAIKLMRNDIQGDDLRQRFQREARLIARLEHPHILPIYDVDAKHEPPYIVMRYADGGTLRDLLEKGMLHFDRIIHLMQEIASALDYAHEKGIIHRDIKPSNILLDQQGNILVSDFGIARVMHSFEMNALELTQAGSIIGTPGYMAPEQGLNTKQLTTQADIYALGVVFFEMITGQMPYTADNNLGLIFKHAHDPIPSATSLNPGLPPAIDAVIARTMAKDPARRFLNCTAFASAITEILGERKTPTGRKKSTGEQAFETYVVQKNGTANAVKKDRTSQRRVPMHLALSLMGSVQIMLNSQPITGFEYDKVRALLIFLCSEPDRPHRRETIAELLWPDQPDQVGRDNLRQALATLRKAIADAKAEPSFLLISRDTLQFNRASAYTLDVIEFTHRIAACEQHTHARLELCAECIGRLERAAELYRGPFAQDLDLPDNEDFQNWLAFQRESLKARALDILYAVTAYHEQRGAFDLARRSAWRQLELEPWREEAYRQLIRVLARSGQRTAALAQYERCCHVLTEELGLDPSPETVALYQEILGGTFTAVTPVTQSGAAILRASVPTIPTSFVGRGSELAQLLGYLTDPTCRIMTITGQGGMGKTRLALEVTRQAKNLFQSVCFVPLAAVTHSDRIAWEIANAIGFTTSNPAELGAQLLAYLRDKNVLLTLDNLEHLDGELRLLTTIAAEAPKVKLLLTSRQKLNLQGEWVLPLKGLPVSEADGDDNTDNAVALFIQRAKMVQPEFNFSSRVLPDILRICRLVDGMPLGIELAAAWMQMLSCKEIADSIAGNYSFLTASTRGLPERHQSLRAVFEHSWTLLPPDQQRVFAALAVFRGGFQADAALEVAGAALPILLALVGKSMLHRNSRGRYEIHELLRQYALEKLASSGATDLIYARHLEHFTHLAETAESELTGGGQRFWLERLEAENDNFSIALAWSLDHGAAATGLRLAAALWFYSQVRAYVRESPAWLDRLLEAAPDAPIVLRAKALAAAGWQAHGRRDFSRAALQSQESLALARQIGDQRSIAYPLSSLAWLSYFEADYDQAETLGVESLALFREINDPWGKVRCLNILGFIAESQGRLPQAEAYQREAVTITRASGDNDSLGWSVYLLGHVLAVRGAYTEAVRCCEQSLEIYRELRNAYGIAVSLYTLGDAAAAVGNFTRAVALCSESVTLLRETGDIWAIGGPLSILGQVAYHQGDYPQATAFCDESYLSFHKSGDRRGMTYVLNILGAVSQAQTRDLDAIAIFKESLTLRQEIGIAHGTEFCFEHLAEIASNQQDFANAAQLFAIAENIRQNFQIPIPPIELARHQENLDRVRERLGGNAFLEAWAAGTALPLNQAIEMTLARIA
jgi:serine/threonine protein kinase/predicted ATPase